ncbi:uncharacterized protein PAC_16955 [Phialocephala subalpina]|uniref:AB hydrolase-1 domain-containing protein n=1 Tax=Phialocephala subalpina TaxID=576137 RepID=A0A1L7XPT9_9HELO|nr:uncharacterized protein PAC_16955 [Phialocephala subalpina]
MTKNNPWERLPSTASLVPIGTHSLHLTAAGPSRKPRDPIAIIVPGLASPTSSWAAVVRILSPSIRTYQYDRSGFGLSEDSPLPPTAENIALELDLLLQAANVEPPYILIAHSWGGILAREFMARRTEGGVVGTVFVEANQERTLEVLDWRPFVWWCIAADADFMEVSGVERERKLNDEEWKVYLADLENERDKKQAAKERDEYENSFETLRQKGQFEKQPPLLAGAAVSIVKGQNGALLRKLFDAVVGKDFGSEIEIRKYGEFLKTFDEKDIGLQSEIRKLSSNSRFVEARNSGHGSEMGDGPIPVPIESQVNSKSCGTNLGATGACRIRPT